MEILVPADIKRFVENYFRAIESASKPLRRVYRGLYESGLTQKALAAEWGVTEKYVKIFNKRLLLYLQNFLLWCKKFCHDTPFTQKLHVIIRVKQKENFNEFIWRVF